MSTIGPTYPVHIIVSQAEVRLVADETSSATAATIKSDQNQIEAAQCLRRCSAPAPRVEPAASLPCAGLPVRIAASAPDRPMDLTNEAGRASTRRANSARGFLPAAAVADLAGTDTKVVFVARHETTIGSQKVDRKSKNAVRVMQHRNGGASEDTVISDFRHVAGDGSRSIERE